MTRFRAGVAGCGGIGRNHAQAYADHDEIVLAGVADIDQSVLAEAATAFPDAATFEDVSAMLAAADLDLLSICTSHRSHARLTVDAAEHGLDGIICEKPMATGLGEATAMRTAADRTDTKLIIGHQTRFALAHERARSVLMDETIGTPEAITVRTTGGLINNGTHFIDLARFVLGDPAPAWCAAHVERRTDRYERGLPAEDSCVGRVCFEDGTRLTVETDTPDPLATDADLVVRGSDGVMTIDYRRRVRICNTDGVEVIEPDANRSLRLRLLDEFLAWIGGETETHRCSAATSVVTVEMMMGLYDAVRTNGIVEFPVETRANPLQVMIDSERLVAEHPGQYDIRQPYASVRRD